MGHGFDIRQQSRERVAVINKSMESEKHALSRLCAPAKLLGCVPSAQLTDSNIGDRAAGWCIISCLCLCVCWRMYSCCSASTQRDL